ncbi:MAG TPA: hydrogenase maturation protease [Polyangiaceae bacterium]|nr:hydrogenase maturation protease [Polyangiaceae bacterium]
MKRILVAGIGNIFFGDDAFGCEVVRALAARSLPRGVVVRDFGIRGLDLSYALGDGYDAAILVDAMPRGGAPGTLYVLEPETHGEAARPFAVEAHSLTPDKVLGQVLALGGTLPSLRIVGCEPAELEPDAELSQAVAAAVSQAADLITGLLEELQGSRPGAVTHA